MIPFLSYPQDVRRVMYTTNAIESLNSTIRRSVRARGHFPSEEAALKLIWLQLREVTKDWKMPAREWHAARTRLAFLFGVRLEMDQSIIRPESHRNPNTPEKLRTRRRETSDLDQETQAG